MSKIIVIPDVHGRTFWKEGIKDKGPDDKVIFLGDYLDPYDDLPEGTTESDILENLEQIIELKRKDPDHVVLLVGNHDRQYSRSSCCQTNRFSYRVNKFINSNGIDFNDEKIFEGAHEEIINGKRFVFSHAGIHKRWLEMIFGFEDLDIEQLNLSFFDPADTTFFDKVISFFRFGAYEFGSMLWADVREYYNEEPFENTVQVFGHTRLKGKPINFGNNYFCLDVSRPFIIKEDGIIREMSGIPVEITEKINNKVK